MKPKKEIIHRPVVWVTGASRGIGREIAKQFALIGCEVCVSARNKKELESCIGEIKQRGGRAYAFLLDISQTKSINQIYKQIKRKLGDVDVLINNAGISSFRSFMDTPQKDFEKIVFTNLIGHAACIREVLPAMMKKKSGWIFNIISMAAVNTYEDSSAYTASKAGMLGLGKVLREELKKFNIKVVNILPGATATDIWHSKVKEKYSHRMMKAKSVAEAILSLYQMPDDVVVDEIVVRPVLGDVG